MRKPVIASICLAVAMVAGPVPATAVDPAPNKCGGNTATGVKSCVFFLKGASLFFNVSSTAAAASARVWITLDGYPETYSLPGVIGCSATGSGSARCSGGYPDETPFLEFPHQASSIFLKLRCHSQATGTWSFGCQAGP